MYISLVARVLFHVANKISYYLEWVTFWYGLGIPYLLCLEGLDQPPPLFTAWFAWWESTANSRWRLFQEVVQRAFGDKVCQSNRKCGAGSIRRAIGLSIISDAFFLNYWLNLPSTVNHVCEIWGYCSHDMWWSLTLPKQLFPWSTRNSC